MNHIDVHALTPEAALGLLSGSERAEVLEHLDGCERCRDWMYELSEVADQLVLVAPSAEPPAGFEQRVLARVGATPARPRRRWPVAVGALAAALLAVVGFAIGRTNTGSGGPVHEVAMRASSGQVVGNAYLHNNDPTWVFVAVAGWTDSATDYHLRVTYADGTTTEVAGDGSWGTVLPQDESSVRSLALIDDDGTVWCSATI